MKADAGRAGLRTRLLRRMESGEPMTEAEFDEAALAVFHHQFAHNAPYRAYGERRGVSPADVRCWTDVPAVPTDAFKAATLLCGDAAAAVAAFRTSGTTAGAERRGTHYFLDLTLYEAAVRAGFAEHLLPGGERLPVLSLIPSPAAAPDSSLSHMLGEVMRSLADGGGYFVGPEGIDLDALLPRLHEAQETGTPVLIPGTSFAFVHLLDELERRGERFRLPAGSRVMDTGGFKGRSRDVPRDELYAAIEARLGVPPAWAVNEYGMTEMSSQFYDGPAGTAGGVVGRVHRGPPWVRSVACDPDTLAPLPPGRVGVLRHCDLANLDSVMALQTADLGVVTGAGLRLLGRASGAEARGCSIAMDELLSAVGDGG